MRVNPRTPFQLEKLPGSVATVAEALLLFVNSMPSPVIPVSHYELCVEHYNNQAIRKKIISSLKPSAQTLFEYLVAFLREIVKHADVNGTNTDYIAQLFSNAILRPDRNLKKHPGENPSCRPGFNPAGQSVGIYI